MSFRRTQKTMRSLHTFISLWNHKSNDDSKMAFLFLYDIYGMRGWEDERGWSLFIRLLINLNDLLKISSRKSKKEKGFSSYFNKILTGLNSRPPNMIHFIALRIYVMAKLGYTDFLGAGSAQTWSWAFT